MKSHNHQILSSVNARLERMVNNALAEHLTSPFLRDRLECTEIRDKISAHIVRRAGGSFLLAELQVNLLRSCLDNTDLKRCLSRQHIELDALVQEAMSRIRSSKSDVMMRLGLRAFIWTTCARRPLSFWELSHCLATYSCQPGFGSNETIRSTMIPSTQNIVEATGYFLHLEANLEEVRIHKTVRDYCAEHRHELFKDGAFDMATICLRYLTLDAFRSGHTKSQEELRSQLRRCPFYTYASIYWGAHVCDAGDYRLLQSETYRLSDILSLSGPMASTSQVLFLCASTHYLSSRAKNSVWTESQDPDEAGLPVLHMLAHFNLAQTARDWVSQTQVKPNATS